MKELKLKEAIKNMIDFIAPTSVEYRNFVINSKEVKKGDIFVGIKGVRNDGNSFYKEAYRNGASLVIFDNPYFYNEAPLNKVLVKDSVEAIKSVGKWKLERSVAKRIAITGSMGKTSTKNLLYSIFSNQYQTYMSYKNYNNELGIAISCANMEDEVDYAIFELGTNSEGEIKTYSNYINPEIAVVTKIGHSHIGNFKTKENIAREKFSIISPDTVKELWIHEDDELFLNKKDLGRIKLFTYGIKEHSDVVLKSVSKTGSIYQFEVEFKGKLYRFELRHFFKHFIMNAVLAAGIALNEGIEYEYIFEGIKSFRPEEKRGEIIKLDDYIIIDDTYNASFESIIAAIDSLDEYEVRSEKFAIIGEMAEIDEFEDKLYSELINYAKAKKGINFLFCGEYFSSFSSQENLKYFKNKAVLYRYLEKINAGVFLVKASRSRKFEEVVDYLKQRGSKKNVI
ncbi:UDP-N-acetylmuramoyl-tripeptide--D-alanyl-D-alanine ligase [Deferribacter autotrophicus]|uniref:UDP-N-acetylmuramoyl-tripeptide--D-alanyl-D-alanine ligase n=1 Tax=Deferribacter autotrophicus TaxID=500465 RepID=A0A5A8F3F4_9BACT|nr:UDP-N-acetylmuramoyl-tripeptide--D-alanyl-D-alanine ligase [Deferribacter autotrophicus]KAA0257857.1 UDP-N-acetylmuramoyl-tripeptide--D-alanyl-D-alanine ligase [Deferribacter autotrophicus]